MLTPERLLTIDHNFVKYYSWKGAYPGQTTLLQRRKLSFVDIEWTSKIQTQLGHQPRHTEGNQKTDAHAGVQGRFREHKGRTELRALPYSSQRKSIQGSRTQTEHNFNWRQVWGTYGFKLTT